MRVRLDTNLKLWVGLGAAVIFAAAALFVLRGAFHEAVANYLSQPQPALSTANELKPSIPPDTLFAARPGSYPISEPMPEPSAVPPPFSSIPTFPPEGRQTAAPTTSAGSTYFLPDTSSLIQRYVPPSLPLPLPNVALPPEQSLPFEPATPSLQVMEPPTLRSPIRLIVGGDTLSGAGEGSTGAAGPLPNIGATPLPAPTAPLGVRR